MKVLLYVILTLFFASLAHSHAVKYKNEIKENAEWEMFQVKYSKTYESPEEKQRRHDMFIETLRGVEEHNIKFEAGKVSYQKAINRFADLLLFEIPQGYVPISNEDSSIVTEYHQPPLNVEIPEHVDWRTKGIVTPVKDQGDCSSCWAFSTTGTLEGQLAKKSKKLVSLSEQNLVDCDHHFVDSCIFGGDPTVAMEYYTRKHGLDSEKSYPYEAKNGPCRFNKTNVVGRDNGVVYVKQDEDSLKTAVATVGPISVAIGVNDDFRQYGKGVFKSDSCPKHLTHAVLVVGYGTENGQDYWLVKNSWGAGWGDGGYIKMARNFNNMCGIANQARYPKV